MPLGARCGASLRVLHAAYSAREDEFPAPEATEEEKNVLTSSKFYTMLREAGVVPASYDHKKVDKLFKHALGQDYLLQKRIGLEAFQTAIALIAEKIAG